jgi:hypothetical protein
MGNPLDCLRRTVLTLEKTWQAWFEESDPKKRKKLEANFEYLLREVETFFGYVNEEWRSAFKKPKTWKYDQEFQHQFVDKFVPSWKKKKRMAR